MLFILITAKLIMFLGHIKNDAGNYLVLVRCKQLYLNGVIFGLPHLQSWQTYMTQRLKIILETP